MKKLIQILAFCAIVATFSLPALAQDTQSTTAAQEGQNDEEAKRKLYETFTANIKNNQQVAYEAGKEYLQKYSADDQYTAYIKKWIAAYEARAKSAKREEVQQLINQKNFNQAFAVGKQVLADNPNDLLTLNRLALAGWIASAGNNNANNTDAINYSKKAIQLIESGATFEEGKPIEKKGEVLAWLNYGLGFLTRKTAPAEAASYFVKAAQLEGEPKKDPQLYLLLADAYKDSEYTKLAKDFAARFTTDEARATPEAQAATAKLKQVADLIIDAYARAIAYATDPKFAQAKTEWMKELTAFYKYRNDGSEAGINELVSGILSKPILTPGSQTSTTTPSTSSTGTTDTTTGNTGTQSSTNASSSTTTQPSNNNKTTTSGSRTPRRR